MGLTGAGWSIDGLAWGSRTKSNGSFDDVCIVETVVEPAVHLSSRAWFGRYLSLQSLYDHFSVRFVLAFFCCVLRRDSTFAAQHQAAVAVVQQVPL